MTILFTIFSLFLFQGEILPEYQNPMIDGYTTIALTVAGIAASLMTEMVHRYTKVKNEYLYGIYIIVSLVIAIGVLFYAEALTGNNIVKSIGLVVAVGYNVFRYLFNTRTAVVTTTIRPLKDSSTL